MSKDFQVGDLVEVYRPLIPSIPLYAKIVLCASPWKEELWGRRLEVTQYSVRLLTGIGCGDLLVVNGLEIRPIQDSVVKALLNL